MSAFSNAATVWLPGIQTRHIPVAVRCRRLEKRYFLGPAHGNRGRLLRRRPLTLPPGNAGLGAETVRRLAAHSPSAIYLCARNPASADPLISEIKSAYPNAKVNIIPVKLDLSSLESTKAAAKTITAQATRLDILYNNAGIAMTPPSLTEDGYETQFAVNHVGHAMFTQALLPLMLQTAATSPPKSVRIVNVSSAAHTRPPANGLALADAKTDMASYHTTKRYGHSKLANVLFAQKLAQLYPSITSVSLHPGFVNTEINTGKAGGAKWFSFLVRNIVGYVGLSVEDGTKTQLWCGVADEVENGKYYVPIGVLNAGSKWAQDETKRDELWQWTEEQLKAHGGPGWPETK
jgi:NAD(P)-dependent dehydrogenase (short-subunit alcohol dehydrogenase family)